MKQHYMRKNNPVYLYENLYDKYKIYVLEAKGLHNFPERKECFQEDFSDSNGITVYQPISHIFKPIKVKFKFAMIGNKDEIKKNFRIFWLTLTSVISYPSTASYGTSDMQYYDSDMEERDAKVIRLTSESNDLTFIPELVEDVQNKGVFVNAITFTCEFSIDKPVDISR